MQRLREGHRASPSPKSTKDGHDMHTGNTCTMQWVHLSSKPRGSHIRECYTDPNFHQNPSLQRTTIGRRKIIIKTYKGDRSTSGSTTHPPESGQNWRAITQLVRTTRRFSQILFCMSGQVRWNSDLNTHTRLASPEAVSEGNRSRSDLIIATLRGSRIRTSAFLACIG